MLTPQDEFPYDPTGTKVETVYSETYKNHKVVINSVNGWFPAAYIQVRKGDKGFNYLYDDVIGVADVHGGFTYSDDHLPTEPADENETWYLGWDYAHTGDYNANLQEVIGRWSGFGLNNMFSWDTEFGDYAGKRYTIGEIVQEARAAIDSITEE